MNVFATNKTSPVRLRQIGGTLLATLVLLGPAYGLDTTLENITLKTGSTSSLLLPKIEITGTNLTQDELAKLFNSATPEAERKALAAKMQASRLAIATATASNTAPAGEARITLSNFVATGIDKGKIAESTLAAMNGTGLTEDGGKFTISTGPLSIKGAEILSLVKGDTEGMVFSAFSLENLTMTAPDKETPASAPGGNLVAFSIASVTGTATFEGTIPLKGSASVKGLVITPPPSSDAAKELAKSGMSKLELALDVASTYDPATQSYALEQAKLGIIGAGALNIRAKLTGVPASVISAASDDRIAALMQAKATSLELVFDDDGLVEKSLGYFAVQQRKSPAALRAESVMMARQMVPVMLGGAGNSLAIADQLARFIENPKQLTVAFRPKSGAISVPEAMMLGNPTAFMQAVDVDVKTITGSGIAAPPAAAPAAAAPAPARTAQAPAATGRLTGLAAWNALVGNTVSGKNDDGQPFFEYYLPNGTVKQLDDTDVATGKWSFKNGTVCIEYPSDDEETCYRLVVDGTTATFTDEDGTGKRYEILTGNAKRL